jgi:hypothetical protein
MSNEKKELSEKAKRNLERNAQIREYRDEVNSPKYSQERKLSGCSMRRTLSQ